MRHANLAEKQNKKNPTFDLVRGVICFCADVFTLSVQNARLLTSFGGGGGVDRRVNLKPPLSIVGSASACFGDVSCTLCIRGFAVHVHTDTKSYLCPNPVQDIYIEVKWIEKYN